MSSSSTATARMSLHEKVQKTRRARQWARTGKSGGETESSTAVESHATTNSGISYSNTLSTPASRAAEIANAHKEKIQRARSVSVGRGDGSVVAGNPPSAFGTSSSSKPKPSVVVSRNESSPATTIPSATPPPAASSYGGGSSRASLIERRQRVLERTGASPARTRSRSPLVQRPSPAAAQQKSFAPAAVTSPPTSTTPASSSTAKPYSVKNRSTVFESSSSSSSTPTPSKSTPTTASSSSKVTPSSSIKNRSSIFEKAERARQAHHHSTSSVESRAPTGTPASTRTGGKATRPSPVATRMNMNNSSSNNNNNSATKSTPQPQASVLSPTSRRMDAVQKSMSSVRSRTSIFEKAEQKRQTNTTTPANSSSSSSSSSGTSSTAAASQSSTAVAMDPSNQSVKNKKNMFEKNRMTPTKNSSTTAAAVTTTTPSSNSNGGGGVEKDTPNSVKSRSNIFEKAEKRQPRSYGQRSPAAAEVSPKPPTFPPRQDQEQEQPRQNNGSSTNSGGSSSVAELKNSFQTKLNTYSDDTNIPKSNQSSPTATSKNNHSSKHWPTSGTPAAFYSSNNGSNTNTTPADRPLSHRPSSITKKDPPESDAANEEKKDDSPERACGNSPSTIVVPSWKQRSTNNSKISASHGGVPIVHQSSWIKNSPTDERMDYAATNQKEQQQQQSTQQQKQSPSTSTRSSGSKGGRRSRSVVATWQAKQAGLSSPDSSIEEDQEQEQQDDDDYVPDPEDIDHVPSDSPTSSFGTGVSNTSGGVIGVGKARSTVGSSSSPAWLTAQKFPSKSPASDVGVSDQYELPSLQKKNSHEAATPTPTHPVTDSSAVARQIAEKVASPARPSWMTEKKFPSNSPATSVVKHDAVTPVESHQSSSVSTARKPVGGLGSSSSNISPRNNAITTSTTSRGTVEGNITKNRTSKPVNATAAAIVVTSATESAISATSSLLWANLAPTSSSSTNHNTNNDTANGDNEDEKEYEEIRTHTNSKRKEQQKQQQHHHDLSLSIEDQSFDDQNRRATTISTSVISATDSKDMSSIGTPNTSLITMNMNDTSLKSLYSSPVKIKAPGFTEDQETVEMEVKSKSSEVSVPQSQQGCVEYIDGRPGVQMNAQQQPQQQVDDDTPSKSLFEMAADSVLIVDYNELQGIALQQTDTHDTDVEEEDDEDVVRTTPAQLPKVIQDIMDGKKQSSSKQQQKHERFFNFDDQSDDDDDNHKQKQQQQLKEQQEDEDQTSAASSNKNDNAVFGEDDGDMYAYVTTDATGAGVEMDAFETSSPERLSNAGRPLPNKLRAIAPLAPSHKDTGSYQDTGRPRRSSPPKKDKNADSPEPPPPPSGTPPSDDELRLRGTPPPQIPNHTTPTMGTGTAYNHDDLPTGSFPSAPSDESFSPKYDASIFGPLVGAFPSPMDFPPQQQEQHRSQSQPRPSSRYQTPETTKSILRESKTEKGRRRSVRFSDPPPPLVVDADAPVSAQRTSAEQDNGSGWEKHNDAFESADNFYSSISPKATPKGPASQSSSSVGQQQTDDPADSYYNSISPRVNTPKDPRNQTFDNLMDEYYGNASPTNAGDADGKNEEDAANILKYWATSDDSQTFNDADQWMDQDPDLDGPGFREDSPSPEPAPIMYNSNNNIAAKPNAGTTDPSFQSMSQAMVSPHPIPPSPPMSPDEAMDVFNPFGTFGCGVSGGFTSSDPFSPISNSRKIDNGEGSIPIHQQGSTASSNRSNGGSDTKNPTSIKLAPSARDERNPTKKRSPPSRSNGMQSSSSSNGSDGRLNNQQQQSYSRSYSGSADWDTCSDINDDWDKPTNNLEI